MCIRDRHEIAGQRFSGVVYLRQNKENPDNPAYILGGLIMNVYDQAHGLAQAIKASEEYKQYDQAKKKIKDNEELENRCV